jgi:hypothetical protein
LVGACDPTVVGTTGTGERLAAAALRTQHMRVISVLRERPAWRDETERHAEYHGESD